MSMSRFIGPLLVVSCLCCANTVIRADQFEVQRRAETLYGQGVHAFYDQQYSSAIRMLGEVEELQSADPRPYYFLGLSYLRTKQDRKADQYLKRAAQFEWKGRGAREYNVSRALRRIQGNERLLIEHYRNQARASWERIETKKAEVKYGTARKEDDAVLTTLSKRPDPLPPSTEPFVGTAPFGARSVDPFHGNQNADAPDSESRLIKADDAVPVQPVEKTDADPFGADDVTEENAEEKTEVPADPFGTDDATEENAEEKTVDPTDPFGADDVTEENAEEKTEVPADPFGTDDVTEENAEEKTVDPADSFGTDDATEEKTDEKAEEPDDDPFDTGDATEKKAENEDDFDPFK